MLIAPAGKPTSAASSASRSAVAGVCGSGLRTTAQPGGERGRELPRRHQERVVPGHDLGRDPDRLLLRVEEERAADRVRAAGDRADRRGEEAEVLDRAADLRLHRRDRLADVARLELRELVAVRLDRVGERVQEARALVRRGLAPVAVERGARSRDRAVDLGLAGELRRSEGLARRRLDELARLGALDGLAVDEEAELAGCGDAHEPDDTAASPSAAARSSPTRTGSVSSFRKRPRSPST